MPNTIAEGLASLIGRCYRAGAYALGVTSQLSDGSNYYDEQTLYQGHPAPQRAFECIRQATVTVPGVGYVELAPANPARIGGCDVTNPTATGGNDFWISLGDNDMGTNGIIVRQGQVRSIQTTSRVRAYHGAGTPTSSSIAEYGVS